MPKEEQAAAGEPPQDPAQAAQEALETLQMLPGTVVLFKFGEGADEVLHEDMKEAFEAFGVKFVDLPRGSTTGYARFESAEVAAEAAAAALDGLEAGGKPLAACHVLSDEETGQYALRRVIHMRAQKEETAKKQAEEKKARRQAMYSRGRGGRGGTRGGFRGGRGGALGGSGNKRPRVEGGVQPAPKKVAP
jgi:RNA binding motif